MNKTYLKHIVELNLAVLLISTSGVLGRYISMPPAITIWWRCVFALILLGAFCWYKKIDFKINSKKDRYTILLSGCFLGAHWVTYFYALQLSNVAIALLSLFTYPVITALLEPLFLKTKLNLKHVGLGLVVLVGIYIISPELSLKNDQTQGVLWGVFSAFLYATRNLILKKKIARYNGSMLMFYQLLIIALLLWPVFFVLDAEISVNDWKALALLAILTTAVGHTLFLRSLKNFSVSSASIMSSIQPIYGILLGLLFLNEVPKAHTLIGGALILITVFVESLSASKR